VPITGDPQNAAERFTAKTLLIPSTYQNSNFMAPLDTTSSFLDGVGSGFMNNGLAMGSVEFIRQGVDTTPSPEYTHGRYLEANEVNSKYLDTYRANADSPMARALFESLADVQNDEMADSVFDQHRAAIEALKTAEEAPWGDFTGSILSLALDGALLVGASVLTGGAAAPAAGAAVARSAGALGARVVGASRLGILGGLEGAGERFVHAQTNPLISSDDILINGLLGVAAGGALGGIFPHALGGVAKPLYKNGPGADLDAVTREIIEGAEARRAAQQGDLRTVEGGPNSLGADASPLDDAARRAKLDERIQVIERGGGTPLARFMPDALRNRKRLIQQRYGAEGRKARKAGLAGKITMYDGISRILHMTPINEGEVGGTLARATSYQGYKGISEARLAARDLTRDLEYDESVEVIYGLEGKLERLSSKARANSEILDAAARKVGRDQRVFSKAEYNEIADRISLADGHNKLANADREAGVPGFHPLIDPEEAIIKELREQLSEKQANALMDLARKTAKADDDWWKRFQEDLVSQDLLDPEDVIAHYRPQIWNTEAMKADSAGWKAWMLTVFRKEPDRAWVQNGWGKQTPDADGTVAPEMWLPEETWQDYAKRMPDEAEEILEDWSLSVRRAAEARADDGLERVTNELTALQAADVSEVRARYTAENAADDKTIATAERLLEAGEDSYRGKKNWNVRKRKLAQAINGAQFRKSERARRLTYLDTAQGSFDELQKILNTIGPKATKGRAKRKLKTVRKHEARVARVSGAKLINDRIDDLYTKMISGENPGRVSDLASQKLTPGRSRLMARQIDLGDQRLSQEARRFLVTDSDQIRRGYNAQVGTTLNLRKAMAPVFRRNHLDIKAQNASDDVSIYKELILEGYVQDISKATKASDSKAVAKLQKEKIAAGNEIDAAFRQILGQEVSAGGSDQLASAVMQTTALASLGGVGISQMADVPLVMLGGSKMSTGFRGMVRARETRRAFHDMKVTDPMSAALMMGVSALEHSRWRALAGISQDEVLAATRPGTRLATYQRWVSEASHVQAYLTGANAWNKWIRSAFGHDFMRQIAADIDDYAKLPEYRKTFYSRSGMSGDDAARMSDLMRRHHKTYGPDGKLRIPDEAAWAKEAPELLERWQMMIKSAGDEVLLDPQISDMPFLRSSAIGRVILQFTSFTFTAAERFIPQLTQGLILHPQNPGIYTAAFMAVAMGLLVDKTKALYNGKNMQDELDKPWADQLWGGILRSPFTVGMSSTLMDNLFNYVGGPLNEAMGANVLPQTSSKFRRDQGYASLLGPTAGMMGSLASIAGDVTDGDIDDAWSKMARITPFANALLIRGSMQAIGAAVGDN